MTAIKIMIVSLTCIGSYLLGSIPFSVWGGQLIKGTDLRTQHTHNPGGFNAIRTFGPGIGLIIMFLDLLKGVLTIALIDHIYSIPYFVTEDASNNYYTIMCILGPALCVMGHNYSIWLKFRGGQGLGVLMGVLMYFNPLVLMFYLLAFMVFVGIFKAIPRVAGFVIVLLCVPVALFMPIGPPWSNILVNLVVGANGLVHLTAGLIITGMNLALLIKLVGNLFTGSSIGKRKIIETS